MSAKDPYLTFNFNDAERDFYKLIMQLSLIPRQDSTVKYNKIKASDLITISKYSKPKVYDLIKRLEEKELIQIDNARPMFLKPLDPEIAIIQLVEKTKIELDENAAKIIQEIKSLPKIQQNYPFSEVPPLNFISGIDEYHKLMRNLLKSARNSVILIIGYLIRYEEEILKDYIKEKLKEEIEIRILYGGSKKFKDFFFEKILEPNGLERQETSGKKDIKAINFAPPIRMTIIDDRELIITLIKSIVQDKKTDILEVSALHSDNENLIDYARRTFALLRPTADAKLAKDFQG